MTHYLISKVKPGIHILLFINDVNCEELKILSDIYILRYLGILPQAIVIRTAGFMDHLKVGFILMYKNTPSINIHINTDM